MQIIYSKTSSKGNCSVIKSKKGSLLILDSGIQYQKVDKEIGYCLHKAEALLITHAHNDHTAHIREFLDSGIQTYVGEETRSTLNISSNIYNVGAISLNKTIHTESFAAVPLEMVHTNHDGTPCECYGFLILDKSSGEKMLWATDTQYIKNKFLPLDFYCIECNYSECSHYDEQIDYIEKVVEQRRIQSHMSVESCIKFLAQQDLSKCKEIWLLHMSNSLSEKEKKQLIRKVKTKIHQKGVIVNG